MKYRKLLLLAALILSLAAAGFAAGCVWLVRGSAGDRIVDDPSRLPVNDVGLVLGTTKRTTWGHYDNPHFTHRMEAAAALYRTGRVRHLLLSGDNGSRGYDEPADMKNALLASGVPEEAMTLDDAGFRTLDSIVRARQVFGQRRVTIITDRFHCYRAVFLARHYGLDAVAFPSPEVDLRYSAKARVREVLADVKACLDLYVLHTRPKFLGDPIAVRVAGR